MEKYIKFFNQQILMLILLKIVYLDRMSEKLKKNS